MSHSILKTHLIISSSTFISCISTCGLKRYAYVHMYVMWCMCVCVNLGKFIYMHTYTGQRRKVNIISSYTTLQLVVLVVSSLADPEA